MTALASSHLPVGFGRGRRTNSIVVFRTATVAWQSLPTAISQWGPEERLDYWSQWATNGFIYAAEMTGFDLVWRLWKKGESQEEVLRRLVEHDAVIILVPRDEDEGLIEQLAARGVPVVLAYGRIGDPRWPWVACDNAGGIAQVVRHLARLGHQRIGFLGGPANVADFQERKQGYLTGMAGLGLPVDPGRMSDTLPDAANAELRAVAAGLLRHSERPTALVCATDGMATAAVEQAWEMGFNVSEDLAVTGFDDSEEALQTIPHLTTVRQPVLEIANRAFYLAACAAVGQEPGTGSWQVELPVSVVIRESCGSAPVPKSAAGGEAALEAGPQTVRQELEWRMRQLAGMNQEMRELLYVASHDLRAPLITIQGFAGTLERRYGEVLEERGRGYLSRIRHSVDNMRELIDALLSLSRAHNQPLDLRPVATREVIRRVLADLESSIAAKRARIRVTRRLPTVVADELALYQVFLNLVDNALKYLGEEREPLISISYQLRPEEHEFSVQDNGVGIAPEHQNEVFQAFRRLGEIETEGGGIGLTTVKRIILRHGGRIWVDSQKGQGATFRFTLPRREVNYDLQSGESARAQGHSRPPRPEGGE
jgi:signal transduction histidine kinase